MKTIAETILERVQALRDKGKTQDAIARHFNVPQQTINLILNGKRKTENLRLYTVQKMFPRSVIYLDGPEKEGCSVHNEDQSVTIGENSFVANGIVKGNVVTTMNGQQDNSGVPTDVLSSILDNRTMSVTEKASLIREIIKK